MGIEKGVVKARTFRRFGSEEERWKKEKVLNLKGLPWELIPGDGRGDQNIGIDVGEDREQGGEREEVEKGEDKEAKQRRINIAKGDVQKYGMTPVCMGCKNGTKGIFTQRITKESEQTIIGSNGKMVCPFFHLTKNLYIAINFLNKAT